MTESKLLLILDLLKELNERMKRIEEALKIKEKK